MLIWLCICPKARASHRTASRPPCSSGGVAPAVLRVLQCGARVSGPQGRAALLYLDPVAQCVAAYLFGELPGGEQVCACGGIVVKVVRQRPEQHRELPGDPIKPAPLPQTMFTPVRYRSSTCGPAWTDTPTPQCSSGSPHPSRSAPSHVFGRTAAGIRHRTGQGNHGHRAKPAGRTR